MTDVPEKWIIEVPGEKPEGANPPWKRLRRLNPETPEADVELLLVELMGVYNTAARATLGGVEILRTRRGRMVKRILPDKTAKEPLMPPTIILSPRFSTDSDDFWRAAVAEGWNVHRAVRYAAPDRVENACVYGEVAFCDMMAERMGLGLLDPANGWLGTLPEELLKRKLWCGTVADLHRVTSRSFVKPANDKVFSFGVYERGEDVPVKWVDTDCPIIVSEVVAFDIEVRLHLLDGEIVQASQYRLVRPGVSEDEALVLAAGFIRHHLKHLDLPSSCVLDVGHIEERGWAVIEANQTYASGVYYQADPRKLLPALLRSSGPKALVRESDRKFLRNP